MHVYQHVVRKLNEGIRRLADHIIAIVLRLIQSAGKTLTVLEEAFLIVGTLASDKYMIDLFLLSSAH